MSTRERILEATTELLAERGLGGTSTRAICEAAGITAPTLYHHFGTKDVLFEAVVAEGLARFLKGKRGAIAGHDPVENVRRGFDQYVAFAVSNPSLYAVIFDRANAEKLPKGAEEAYGMLTHLLSETEKERGLRVGTELAAQAVWAAAHGVSSLLVSRPGFGWDDALVATAREAVIGAVVAGPREANEEVPETNASVVEESETKEYEQ
jgi:AcrR family transcriptional regulator